MRAWGRFLAVVIGLGVGASSLVLPLSAEETSTARLTFIKTFPGSAPEYTRLTVQENGESVYQGGSAGKKEDREQFRLSAALTSQLFGLAAELNYFRGIELESGRSVANMGQKIFIFEKDGERAEVSYNYTRNNTAEKLQELFEGIAQTRYWIPQLEFHLHYDRLGMLDTLRRFERDFNAGGLVAAEQLVPVLERIAGDGRLMQLARARAQELRRRIRGAPARLQFEYGDQASGWYSKVILEQSGTPRFESRRFGEAADLRPLAIPPAVARRLWELVGQANYLRGLTAYQEPGGRLSGYRLIYEAGVEHNEVLFSTAPTATVAEIVHTFQQLLQQEHFRKRLRRALEESSVTLQVVLQELEAAVQADQLADPKEFVPLLEEVVNGSRYHELTRQQAQRLLRRIRGENE
ncbi:MAG: hypothetical protein ACE5HL_03435 [Terriglobia bacterium]